LPFINDIENIFPSELLNKRNIIEGNVIACLYSNNELFRELKDLTEKDFITVEGLLYYRLGLGITQQGAKIIDKTAIYTYLENKPTIKEQFEEYGGYDSIKDMVNTINIENYESYYDALLKYNILNRLHIKGFNVLDNINKFDNMHSKQVYDWFDYLLNDTFIKVGNSLKPVDLTEESTWDDFLKRVDSGADNGIPIDCKLLNYHLAGLHRGNILLHTAHSGVGKTSSAITLYILPLLKQNKKVVLLINEQSADDWRKMLLPSVVNNILHSPNKWLNRQRMQYGGFTDAEWEVIGDAKKWITNQQRRGNLIFYPMEDYSARTIKQIIKKMMRLDSETTFILDTWKPSDESGERAWAQFTEESKEIYNIVKPEDVGGLNVRFIATAQLSGGTVTQRYLNVNALAKSKSVKEVVGQLLMFRKVWQDEYDESSKKYLRPFNYIKKEDGTWSQSKQTITLDKDKEYTILFIDKNRYGKDNIQLLFESNLDFNTWKCIGFCVVCQDY
jgi:replicative DNA helicase